MNIVYKSNGMVVEIHCDDKPKRGVGTVEVGGVTVPFSNINLGQRNVIIQIPFEDLTMFDDASYEETINGRRAANSGVEVQEVRKDGTP
jgi:hypothetical protein